MAVDALSQTTLSEALDQYKNRFRVAATTNINVGDYLVCRAEAMKVREVLAGNWISVVRGVGGTQPRQHKDGQRFYIGSPDKFKAIKESLTALVGDSGTYPDFMLPGQRGKDHAGNEYILLDVFNFTAYKGQTVVISNGDDSFYCTVAFAGKQGPVAVLVEGGTSAQYVWGQIYGSCPYAMDGDATSGATSAYIPLAQSSASSPVAGMVAKTGALGAYPIYGMFISGIATTATTSDSSAVGVGVPVWLNYPYIRNFVEGTSIAP